MAKLHFLYSVMNAGKTTHLLQVHHNYIENGGNVLLFTSSIDDRFGVGKVKSRIGIEADAISLKRSDAIDRIVAAEHAERPLTAVLIDEVQFMTPEQVRQLVWIVDELKDSGDGVWAEEQRLWHVVQRGHRHHDGDG